MTTLVYVLTVIVIVLGLSILFLAVMYYRGKGRAASSDLGDDDNYDDEDDESDEGTEVHCTVTSFPRDLIMGGSDKSSDVDTSKNDCKTLDFDAFMDPGLLDEEDDEEKLRNCVNRMVERTHEMLPLIVRVITELKRGFDDDFTEATFIKMKDHLWSEIQGYHDTIEAINLYVGVNSEFLDQIVEIEKALAEVEGYNL